MKTLQQSTTNFRIFLGIGFGISKLQINHIHAREEITILIFLCFQYEIVNWFQLNNE